MNYPITLTTADIDADTEYRRDIYGATTAVLALPGLNLVFKDPDEIERMARELSSAAESLRLARIASGVAA